MVVAGVELLPELAACAGVSGVGLFRAWARVALGVGSVDTRVSPKIGLSAGLSAGEVTMDGTGGFASDVLANLLE